MAPTTLSIKAYFRHWHERHRSGQHFIKCHYAECHWVQRTSDEEKKVLCDPNTWAVTAATSLYQDESALIGVKLRGPGLFWNRRCYKIVSFSSVTDRSPRKNTLAYSWQRRWRRRKKGVYNTLTTCGRFHKHFKHVAYQSSIISYAHLSIYCMHVLWHAASIREIDFLPILIPRCSYFQDLTRND
jgi:hypothetical protein